MTFSKLNNIIDFNTDAEYPGGMEEPMRKYSSTNQYRYGFNGKENDKDAGEGIQNYGMRIYDRRLGRFLSTDPLIKKYPELTPYQFASNTPIQAIDLDGLERLDVASYDAKTRTAEIQVVKNVYINSNNIPTQVSALGNTTFASIFSAGNTSIYVSVMPQNGQPLQVIDRNTYNKGTGFKLDISYNVTVQNTTTPSNIDLTNNSNVLVQTGAVTDFSNPLTFARATVNNSNTVAINPNFTGFAPPEEWDAISVPSYEELVAHEVGFHTMGRELHQPDRKGNPVYPTNRTLESNLPGQIRPNSTNTQTIINVALNAGNLNDPINLLPRPAVIPAAPTPDATSAKGNPVAPKTPPHQKN
jgi:hypothetical protein